MMSVKGHKIKAVRPGSISEALELSPGDLVLSVDGHELEDIFDYEYYTKSESIVMEVQKSDGELWEMEIENDYEDLGLTFENGLMSEYRTCRNKCVFCFIDQMPPGMRDTLYFKDDDSRLSFLQGNYVTLTNISDRDIQRIIEFKLAPINISVHAMNPKLRCEMLHNRFAGKSLGRIKQLYEAKIPMNGQIVLCKGYNDGEELDRSIRELSAYLPYMESVSVVPVGLSKFRKGLCRLEPITREDAISALELIEGWQRRLYAQWNSHFVHASDEFYILAGRPLPEEERYDGYIQLENGVGMLRLLETEVAAALLELSGDGEEEEVSIATGILAAPYITAHAKSIGEKFPGRTIHVYPITNYFFGEQITVAGLITGQDLISQLKGKRLGKRLLLPECMFRSGEEVFLDDVTRDEVQKALQVKVTIVKSSGQDLVRAVLSSVEGSPAYEGYELKEISYE